MAVSGWAATRLGEIVAIKHGWPFKSECFNEHLTGQPIVVAVGNFRYTGGFRFDEKMKRLTATLREQQAEAAKLDAAIAANLKELGNGA